MALSFDLGTPIVATSFAVTHVGAGDAGIDADLYVRPLATVAHVTPVFAVGVFGKAAKDGTASGVSMRTGIELRRGETSSSVEVGLTKMQWGDTAMKAPFIKLSFGFAL
ncbi:MAG: hypothetical protein IT381_03935 [Deltaproteobacteria bacterium]|nr:hypothetical protein [Deltaproteobacteria bacterium]